MDTEENPPLPPDDPPEPAQDGPAPPTDEQTVSDQAGPSILGQEDTKEPAMTAAEEEALLKVLLWTQFLPGLLLTETESQPN